MSECLFGTWILLLLICFFEKKKHQGKSLPIPIRLQPQLIVHEELTGELWEENWSWTSAGSNEGAGGDWLPWRGRKSRWTPTSHPLHPLLKLVQAASGSSSRVDPPAVPPLNQLTSSPPNEAPPPRSACHFLPPTREESRSFHKGSKTYSFSQKKKENWFFFFRFLKTFEK